MPTQNTPRNSAFDKDLQEAVIEASAGSIGTYVGLYHRGATKLQAELFDRKWFPANLLDRAFHYTSREKTLTPEELVTAVRNVGIGEGKSNDQLLDLFGDSRIGILLKAEMTIRPIQNRGGTPQEFSARYVSNDGWKY